jgi:hypothetical protein
MYAYKGGSIMSDSVSVSIDQHDSYGTFQLNLASATGGDGTMNPFTSTTAAASNTGMTAGVSSNNSTMNPTNTMNMGTTDPHQRQLMDGTTAHGIMGAAAFVLLFPSGSIVMRIFNFKHLIWVHVGIQIMGYIMALAVMETGVWIAVHNGQMMEAHPLLGLVVVCGLFFQPFLGLGHHILFKRKGGPNALTYPHIWWGRVLITVGIVNGFFGLRLAEISVSIEIAYASVAGVIWLIWMAVAALIFLRDRNVEPVREKPYIRRIDSYDE